MFPWLKRTASDSRRRRAAAHRLISFEPLEARLPFTAGLLDPSWDRDGIVEDGRPGEEQNVTAIAKDVTSLSDGRVLAVVEDQSQLYLYRYRADGSSDSAYGDGGRVLIPRAQTQAVPSLKPQIITSSNALYVVVDDRRALAIARLTPSGEINSSFGAMGWVEFSYDAVIPGFVLGGDGIFTMQGAPGGGFFVGGSVVHIANHPERTSDYLIFKILEDGRRDTSFGIDGIVRIPKEVSIADDGLQLCVQPDGKLVALLSNTLGQPFNTVLQRFSVTGEMDTDFGEDGIIGARRSTGYYFGGGNWIVLCGPDENLTVVGNNGSTLVTARFDSEGQSVPQFGASGRVHEPFQQTTWVAATFDDVQRIILAGHATANSQFDWTVVRLSADGKLDDSFSDDGFLRVDVHGFNDLVYDMETTSTGDILVSGLTRTEKDSFAAIARIATGERGLSIWQRRPLTEDVDNDGSVTPADALAIVNDLNRSGIRKLPPQLHEGLATIKLDVNGDHWATALDALIVINKLNQPQPAGESTDSVLGKPWSESLAFRNRNESTGQLRENSSAPVRHDFRSTPSCNEARSRIANSSRIIFAGSALPPNQYSSVTGWPLVDTLELMSTQNKSRQRSFCPELLKSKECSQTPSVRLARQHQDNGP